ncbi:MAG: rhomboid family intramembrane serine protease [Myxococcota bacterium]
MDIPLRCAADQATAETWALVLSSQSIPSQLVRGDAGWEVCVEVREADRARQVLAAYDRDLEEDAVRARPALEYGPTATGLLLAALLCAMFLVSGPYDPAAAWSRAGSAAAERILAGEWWRTATALTLHADLPHLLGNAASLAIFGTAVCWSLGPGLGAGLILLSGMLGNAASAAVYGPGHLSVGASTAVFGAIGILCGQQFVRRRALRSGSRPAWVALAVGLALLALLGTGERSDMAAHAFGLLAGGALGSLAAVSLARSPGAVVQTLALLASAVALTVAWLAALGSSP